MHAMNRAAVDTVHASQPGLSTSSSSSPSSSPWYRQHSSSSSSSKNQGSFDCVALRCRTVPYGNATHPVWTNLQSMFSINSTQTLGDIIIIILDFALHYANNFHLILFLASTDQGHILTPFVLSVTQQD